MPLFSIINHDHNTTILVWQITESFDDLLVDTILNNQSIARLSTMKSENHRCGFLAIRKMLLLVELSDFDVYYSTSGKPFLKNNQHLSISHSHEMATLIISNQPVGIDVELIKPKTIRIAKRFMDILHINDLTDQDAVKKATIIWGIKEVVFKIVNQPGISYPDHIFENQFNVNDCQTKAQLRDENNILNFDIHFKIINPYTIVWGFAD